MGRGSRGSRLPISVQANVPILHELPLGPAVTSAGDVRKEHQGAHDFYLSGDSGDDRGPWQAANPVDVCCKTVTNGVLQVFGGCKEAESLRIFEVLARKHIMASLDWECDRYDGNRYDLHARPFVVGALACEQSTA